MMRYALSFICLLAGQAASADQGVEDAYAYVQQSVEAEVTSQVKKQSAQLLAEASERMISQAHESVWNALDKPQKRRPFNRNAPSHAEAAKLFKEGSEYILDSVGNFTQELEKRRSKGDRNSGEEKPYLVQHSWRVVALMAVEIAQMADTLLTGRQCFFTNSFLFFVMGGICLVREEHLSPADAVVVLFQQMTTVGYGSNVPANGSSHVYTDTELRIWKMFHGLHAWFGNLLVNGQMTAAWKATLQNMERLLIKKYAISRSMLKGFQTILATLFWSLVYWGDQGTFTDGFYLTLMTMSTVGYGDLSPTNPWAKWLSPFFMIWGTHAYGDLTNQLQGSFDPTTGAPPDDTSLLKQTWDTWKRGLGKWYSDCWESNKDITISFAYEPARPDAADINDDDCKAPNEGGVSPREIVTALSHGWKLPLGLDISVLPINKGRLEGKSCVFHMRLNNVPWQMVSDIKEKMNMGDEDMEDLQAVSTKAAETYREAKKCQEPDAADDCIACKNTEKCVRVQKLQAHDLHMPMEK